MKKFVKEFKEFVATGNMVELAVAVILGAAIAAAIGAFTNGIVMQAVAALFGQPDFGGITWTIRHNVSTDDAGNPVDATLQIGAFINTLITLVVTGLVLFLMIKAYNRMRQAKTADEPSEPAGPSEVDLLIEIRDALRNR